MRSPAWTQIKKGWNRLCSITLREKTVFVILLAGLVLLLVPMLVLARYNVPSADDFTYAILTVHAWRQTHSLLAVLGAAVRQMAETYMTWQGTFCGVIAFALQPAIFGDAWYFLAPWIILAALLPGTFYFTDAVVHRLLGATRLQAAIVGTCFGIAFTQPLPSPVQGFYWWNGAVYYTFFYGFDLILYALLAVEVFGKRAAISPARRALRTAGLVLLSVMAGGANFAAALLTAMVYVLAVGAALLLKRKLRFILVPCAAFFAAFAVSALAPGNSVRQAEETKAPILWAIKQSFAYGWDYLCRWFSPFLLLLLLFLAPLLWRLASRLGWDFRCPQLFVLGSYCLFSALFCPILYAESAVYPVPGRYEDILYYTYVILLTANLFYLMGWVSRTMGAGPAAAAGDREQRYPLARCLALALLLAAAFAVFGDDMHLTSYYALRDLRNGNAASYYATAQQRFAMLADPEQKDAALPRFTQLPYVLFFDDIPDKPDYWKNEDMAAYYDKGSIRLAPPE